MTFGAAWLVALRGAGPSASPAEARAYRAGEVEKWGKLVRTIGVKAE